MSDLVKSGKVLSIVSFKHNGAFHRSWSRSVVLDPGEPLLLANRNVEVLESNGERWVTEGLAICQFYRYKWFNIILLMEKDRLQRYYCNIASPIQIDKGTLTYVDYDLDLIVDPSLNYTWLDEEEYQHNQKRMAYPEKLAQQIRQAASELERKVQLHQPPFHPEFVRQGYHQYLQYEKQLMGWK